jgi:hypothetical protein
MKKSTNKILLVSYLIKINRTDKTIETIQLFYDI